MFNVYAREVSDVEPIRVLPGAEGLAMGMAVKFTAGALAKAAATEGYGAKVVLHGDCYDDAYIVMGPAVPGPESGLLYPAIRVLPTTIFSAPASGAVAQAGGLVTLAEDGLGVTNTAESGVFTVLHTQNKAGTPVLGYFA